MFSEHPMLSNVQRFISANFRYNLKPCIRRKSSGRPTVMSCFLKEEGWLESGDKYSMQHFVQVK